MFGWYPKVHPTCGTHMNIGEDNPCSKLKEWMVRDMRFVFAITTNTIRAQKLMAKYYGVSEGTVVDVRLRRTWRHV